MAVFSMAGSNPALPTYPLQRSVRLRSSASAYFNRTFGTATNASKWTKSFWVKRGTLGTVPIIAAQTVSASANYAIQFNADNTLTWQFSNTLFLTTTQVFRDPSAWYHIVMVWDAANATAANRAILYINGVQVTAFVTDNRASVSASQNAWETAGTGYISYNNGTNSFDGYLEEYNFIDGQALTPSSFGAYNSYGVWSPAKYTGTYGTNGFYLNFQDNSALTTTANIGIGKDSSGNGNYWTSNNISLTAGVTYDSMLDVPTLTSATNSNYPTLNPVDNTGVTITNGNLTATTPGSNQACKATMSLPTTGKWYFEVTDVVTGGTNAVGIANVTSPTNTSLYLATGSIWVGMSSNAVFGFAFNFDALTYTIYKNNSVDSSGSITSGITYIPFMQTSAVGGASTAFNFGQRPFSYTPPTGFNRLCTYNLPDSIVPVGAQYMAATLYTGTGANLSITNTVNGASMQPDFVWIKGRSVTYNNALFDSIRGVRNVLISNNTAAEGAEPAGSSLTAFNSNGFTLGGGAATFAAVNVSPVTFVGWQWRASNASAVTNTSGSITSQVSANQTAGFSVVTYTGNGSANATVGHGLGVAPKMIIVKARNSSTYAWNSYHVGLTPGYYIQLNTTSPQDNSVSIFPSGGVTSSVWNTGGSPIYNNGSAVTYVAYCFAAVPGYSSFGSYTGNGSTDGPFVYTGFRPRFILLKLTSSAGGGWYIYDTSRNTYNVMNLYLRPDASDAETTFTTLDSLSNGFKVRTTSTQFNGSGSTYIYAAFAENPFKNALAR